MPIPFHDQDEVEQLGAAAFFKVFADDEVLADDGTPVHRAALFIINARGEPLEFKYHEMKIPPASLWHWRDLRAHAVRTLIGSLLSVCQQAPRLLLCLADEVDNGLFGREIGLTIPVGRLSLSVAASGHGSQEEHQIVAAAGEAAPPVHVFWHSDRPTVGSDAAHLFDCLAARSLLLEPFARVATATAGGARPDPVSAPGTQPEVAGTDRAKAGSAPQPDEPVGMTELPLLLQPPVDLLLNPRGPIPWPHSLYEFQLDGIKALLTSPALLLADDMGLGKTIQVIGAVRVLALRRQLTQVLVIVPASLVSQWRREFRRWAPELRVSTVSGPGSDRAWQWRTPAHVYLISYETFRSDFTGNPQSPPRRRFWDVVVLDEAQKIKNRETEVSEKCKQLHRRRAWAVTGTPLENTVDDLASILEFAVPLLPGERAPRFSYGPGLLARHRQLQLRRKKFDVLHQLPPKTVTELTLNLTDAQLRSYKRAARKGIVQLRARGETIKIHHVLELIMRLKQICNFCPETGQSAKLADVRERLEILQSEGYRALIFAQFIDEVFGVHKIVAELAAFQPLAYTGELAPVERDAVLKKFRGNQQYKALVLSLRAGGQGLNLQDASYVFHFDRWWNPAVEQQAEDRSHRLGQVVPVHVYKYICADTIEEQIDRVLKKKQQLFDELVDDVSVDLQAKLTAAELFGLFGLAPPASIRAGR